MEEHDEINWGAVLREHLEGELDAVERRTLAHAVSTSERLSRAIDDAEVGDRNTAELVRAWRDRRYGPDG